MATTCTVERPGLKPYKARKQPTAEYWVEDVTGAAGVTVLRTHDIELAANMADIVMHLHFVRDLRPISAGELLWMRRNQAGQWVRVPFTKRGAVPAVVFQVVRS